MITFEQALTENEFHEEGHLGCQRIIGPRGGIRETSIVWRRNGATKTWKRTQGRFRIPIKFGMWSYDSLTDTNANVFHLPADCPLKDPDYVTVDGRKLQGNKA